MFDVLKELCRIILVNDAETYGTYGYILFGLIRFGILSKSEGVLSAIEIYIGITIHFTFKIRLEKTNIKNLINENSK